VNLFYSFLTKDIGNFKIFLRHKSMFILCFQWLIAARLGYRKLWILRPMGISDFTLKAIYINWGLHHGPSMLKRLLRDRAPISRGRPVQQPTVRLSLKSLATTGFEFLILGMREGLLIGWDSTNVAIHEWIENLICFLLKYAATKQTQWRRTIYPNFGLKAIFVSYLNTQQLNKLNEEERSIQVWQSRGRPKQENHLSKFDRLTFKCWSFKTFKEGTWMWLKTGVHNDNQQEHQAIRSKTKKWKKE